MFFVEVIIPLSLANTFTYSVNNDEYEYLQIGMRVAVPFGKSKVYTAMVIDKHQTRPTAYDAKDIYQILDEKPIVTTNQIQFWKWIANYYMCSIGDVFKSAMPSALLLETETLISKSSQDFIDTNQFSDDEFLVYQALEQQTSLRIQEIISILNKKNVLPVIHKLIAKKAVFLEEEMVETYKPKQIRYVRLSENFHQPDSLQLLLEQIKSEKQKALILNYFQLIATTSKPISIKQLIELSGVTNAVLKTLIDKNIFEDYILNVDRVQFDQEISLSSLQLSSAQNLALQKIQDSFLNKDVTLLHGVTASGKTEIYIKLIEDFLKLDKQVLFLLPEIALTTQLVTRLTKYFGNQVAVYHSKYSNNERVEVWQQVIENAGKAQVIIGARSAIFLPFQNLGLIVVDEEHEQTYKQQDPAPRYHARDSAIVLAHFYKAKVLLGSATPSLETYYNVQNQKYGLVEIFERFGNVTLPEIHLVDLKDKYFRKKMKGHFSDTLLEKISEELSKGKQVILFQNRRGYSPVIECMTCGTVPTCQQCAVSLTYHKFKGQLRCHYCGYSIAKPQRCQACSSIDLTTKGFGTEQIQQELNEIFPDVKVARMDQDTTKGKFAFEKLIDGFKNQEIDILVGTQMLAKGLDFGNVSLVGVLNADNMLYHPDFRAFERSYQMLTQVAGRSGRSTERGQVIIQTYNPNHNIIRQVTENDYQGMVKEQMYERKIYFYPPYFRLIKLTLKHKDFEKLNNGANWLYAVLKNNLQIPVLGPEEPVINRIRNEYIKTIVIKMPQEINLNSVKKIVQKSLNSFEAIGEYRSIKVIANVDFY